MKLRLRPRHLLVFAVVGKEKYKGLYTPTKSSYSDYTETMEVWIAGMGPDCKCVEDGIGLGARCYLLDYYELETEIPFHIMQEVATKVNFEDGIMKSATESGGTIKAYIIHENSLVLMEEDSWKKKPILSWEQLSLENQS